MGEKRVKEKEGNHFLGGAGFFFPPLRLQYIIATRPSASRMTRNRPPISGSRPLADGFSLFHGLGFGQGFHNQRFHRLAVLQEGYPVVARKVEGQVEVAFVVGLAGEVLARRVRDHIVASYARAVVLACLAGLAVPYDAA